MTAGERIGNAPGSDPGDAQGCTTTAWVIAVVLWDPVKRSHWVGVRGTDAQSVAAVAAQIAESAMSGRADSGSRTPSKQSGRPKSQARRPGRSQGQSR
jgi:hypothetical protein